MTLVLLLLVGLLALQTHGRAPHTTNVVRFRHVHVSGYHGATGAQIRAILDTHRANAAVAVITGTENYNGQDDLAWKAAGWQTFRVGELTITWRTSVLEQARPDQAGWGRQLTDLPWFRGTGDLLNGLSSACVHLRVIENERRVIIRWAHMPSSVQEGGGWSKVAQRVRVYHAAMRSWRHIVRLSLRNHPDAVLIIVADWNLDHGRRWVRRYLRRYLKPLEPVLAHEGTLGSREIDVAWVGGAGTSEPEVHNRRPGVDHKATSYELAA